MKWWEGTGERELERNVACVRERKKEREKEREVKEWDIPLTAIPQLGRGSEFDIYGHGCRCAKVPAAEQRGLRQLL